MNRSLERRDPLAQQSSGSPTARSARAPGRIVSSTRLSALSRIAVSEVSAVIIQRSLATPLHQLESVVPEPGFCRMVALGNAFSATHLVGSGFPSHVARRLEHDIDLLHRAVRSVHQGAGHAQLFVTRSDECRKFHVDYYRLRVLVTYVGPGTEIALERGLNRAALGTLGDDVEGANRCILSPNVQPMRAPGGAVVVLKGARWGSGLPAVHRSPPLAGPRRARLVLKLTVE